MGAISSSEESDLLFFAGLVVEGVHQISEASGSKPLGEASR